MYEDENNIHDCYCRMKEKQIQTGHLRGLLVLELNIIGK